MTVVNRTELSSLLGCSLPTINAKVTKGMPYIQKGGRGKEWSFETGDVIEWEKRQAVSNVMGDLSQVDEEELKLRKLAAETAIVEIEVAKQKCEVAPVSDFEKATRDLCIELSSLMMLVPQRAAPDNPELKRLIETEIKEALTDAMGIELDHGA